MAALTPPVSPTPLEGADSEPTGFVVRQNANVAFGLVFSATEMRDAHDIVEENAWIAPAFRSQYYGHPPTADTPWYLDATTQTVVTHPTEVFTVAVPAVAGRIALAAHQLQRTIAFWDREEEGPAAAEYRRHHRLLVRILCAHIAGHPPTDEPGVEERERRATLVAELATERAAEEAAAVAAEAARYRRATEVWVRLISPQRGYIQIVGTIDDMERRRWEEAGPDDMPAAVDPAAEGLRTADQLCDGCAITNAQLLRLVQIRDDLEMEYDSHYTDEDAIRRLKREETQILRAITIAFRTHRTRYAPLAVHAAAVRTGDVRHARISARRRHAIAVFALNN
jgi:hypothetical protein